MRESSIESYLVRKVKEHGGLCYKFVSPGNPGVPDRIVITPTGKTVYVELKTEIGRLAKMQKWQRSELEKRGADVRVLYTGYTIGSRVEDNKTLFDIIQTALDETLKATSQMYVLYDDVGKLTLKNIGSMKLGLLIDEDTAGDFDYKSSIASQTYDKIKLSYENKDTGAREIFVAQDSANINQWGVLQYYEKLDSTTNAKAMADALLSLYNTKTRTLKLKDVLGDIRVRAGTLLVVMLGLGDMNVSSYLMVEQVKHTFNNEQHLMELKMRGGTFVT